jgi:hypothetical protein
MPKYYWNGNRIVSRILRRDNGGCSIIVPRQRTTIMFSVSWQCGGGGVFCGRR